MSQYQTTPKQSIAFPEAALIRKGTAKQIGQNGKETVGKDLNDKFRVQFYPGVDPAIVKTFTDVYGLTPQRIKAFIPFPHISEAFSSFNEAHNAGRMIAQADHDHYLMKRNPLNGQYEVRNGEPYTPFQPGEKISYTNHQGKIIELPIKATNRLRLVIPEVVMTGRLVTFTFKSTSVYDRFNLEQQLGAIQALANTLNRGNAAGIPFWLYRAEREITWNKADGSASRIKKWLVHLEPDAEWVKSAFERMSKFALTGSNAPALPTPEEPLEVDDDFGDDPEEDDDDALFGEEPVILEGQARDVPPPPPATRPASQPARTTPRPAPATRPATRPAATSVPRTLPPAQTRKTAPATPATDEAVTPEMAELDTLGKQIWNGKWDTVKPALMKKGQTTTGALKLVKDRLATLNDLDGLLKHIETNWPSAVSFVPLAWGEVAEKIGVVDPLMFLAAVTKATPKLSNVTEPKNGAAIILSHYPEPIPA